MAILVWRLVTCGIFFALTNGQMLVLKPQQESHTKPEGSAIVLTCEVTGATDDTDFNVQWFDNGDNEITDRTGRLYIEDDSINIKKLYITSIKLEDAGKYSCRARVAGQDYAKQVTLQLFRGITFEDFPDQQNPTIYTDALIQCAVNGEPKPEVSWRYKGKRLHEGQRYSINASSGLLIRNITEQDNGEYMCRGEVEADGRYSEQKITVTVYIPPTITKSPGMVEATKDASISVVCEAEGLPHPHYKFFKDDGEEPLGSSENLVVNETIGYVSFLLVRKEDQGKYTCKAINDVGSDTAVGELRVLVKPVIQEFSDVTELEGESVSLVCLSEGEPQPTMTLHKEKSSEEPDIDLEEDEIQYLNASISKPGELQFIISPLTQKDAGLYTCTSTNKVGSDTKAATVGVDFKPRFAHKHQEVYNWVGEPHNLTCESLGQPPPTIQWLHSDVILENNETYHIYSMGINSNLQVTVREVDQSWIYGSYVCRASNQHGQADSTIEMIRATIPDAPSKVRVVERYPTVIAVEAEPPSFNGGVDVTGYSVEYSERIQDTVDVSYEDNETESPIVTDKPGPVLTVESTDEKIRIENLKANTTYILKVRAKNDVGLGIPVEVDASTEAFKRPNPVVIKSHNRSIEPFEYTVTWESPNTGGLPIKQYEFSIKKLVFNKDTQLPEDAADSEWTPYQFLDHGRLSHTLKGLSAGSYYHLKIRAQNNVGWSDPTQEFLFSTSEDPNAIPSTPIEEWTTEFVFAETTKEEEEGHAESSSQQASVNAGLIIGIVLVIFIIFLVIVDICCCKINKCGVTMILYTKFCGKKASHREKSVEDGEKEQLNKANVSEDKDEDSKKALKDEIQLEDSKAIDSKDIGLVESTADV